MGQQPWGTDYWSLRNFSIKKQPIHCHGETVFYCCCCFLNAMIWLKARLQRLQDFGRCALLLFSWHYFVNGFTHQWEMGRSQLHFRSFQEGNSEKWSLKLYCFWCVICKSSLVFLHVLFLFVLLSVKISCKQQHSGISWPSLPYLGDSDGSEKHKFLRPKPPTLICLKLMSETQYCTDRRHCL